MRTTRKIITGIGLLAAMMFIVAGTYMGSVYSVERNFINYRSLQLETTDSGAKKYIVVPFNYGYPSYYYGYTYYSIAP